jgi:membrane protein DedA with SNARE-associated domain
MSPFVMAGIEQHILSFVKQFLGIVGYPGIFLLMMMEGFGIPIPSELTMPFSGFLSSSAGGSKFSLSLAIAVGTAGEVVGGVLAYVLGYFGGRPLLERYGRFVMLGEDELARGEQWFSRYGDRVVLLMRLLPAVRSFIALPAGVVRMPFWRFLLYSAVGCLIWCAALAFVGHQLGQHWQSVNKDVHRYNGLILAVTVLLIAAGLYIRMARAHRNGIDTSNHEEIQPTGT